ncbi:histidine utilization repressor [Hoeflea marina]|nr:histidine utilization repressor [Hoeflea marina]
MRRDAGGQEPVATGEPHPKEATLHQRILGEIEGRILSGEWPPGHRIPFEVDLAALYGCSRMTVNKVMTRLADAGLIERRKKSGSFVIQPQAQSAVLDIHDIADEVASLNLTHSHSVVSRERRRAGAEDMRRLDLPKSSAVIDVVSLHRAGARPFCLEERIISLANVPDAAQADFAATTAGAWMLNQVPWSMAEHRIRAVGAGPREAGLLGIESGAACLIVERRTWSNAGPLTHVRFTYPGDRHGLIARFTPSGQALS